MSCRGEMHHVIPTRVRYGTIPTIPSTLEEGTKQGEPIGQADSLVTASLHVFDIASESLQAGVEQQQFTQTAPCKLPYILLVFRIVVLLES